MAKVQTINFNDFMRGANKPIKNNTKVAFIGSTIATSTLIPNIVLAAGDTYGNVHQAIMNGFDSGVVLIIIFAGASWCFGHRSKAIEILIGVACGYLLARHSIDIRDFLKTI